MFKIIELKKKQEENTQEKSLVIQILNNQKGT